ncbi:DUF5666 domain-containing protein [Falsiroseomonas sp. HW251]|uniref:DUF5666 domain-containing protein n=1 Tax=Falsiroseomonas sp. HW251 TaxID=3390998 RepID=UPI003D31C16A
MTRRRDALRAIPALTLLAAGCAPVARRFAGGDEEGGIGGTGIFGTVTALGSLQVNGLLVETGAGTRIETLTGGPVLPGDTVAVEAARAEGRLVARGVTAFHPVMGPIGALPDSGLSVLGTSVAVEPGVPVRAADGSVLPAAVLRPGQMVAVSGLWRGDSVVATALRLVEPASGAVLRGQLRRRGLAWQVGGTQLLFRGLMPNLPEEGFVTVRGAARPEGLVVESLEEQPLMVFSRRIDALSVEGFGAVNRGAPGFHLAGFGLPLDPTSPAVPPPGERWLLLGQRGATFRVAEGLALPADPARRAALLEGPEASALIRRWLAAA